MNYPQILNDIYEHVQPLLGQGRVANYIPELAHISPHKFGMAVQMVDGRSCQIGDADEPFSIQSMSKLFTLTLAMQLAGDSIWQRIGREPSGTPFRNEK